MTEEGFELADVEREFYQHLVASDLEAINRHLPSDQALDATDRELEVYVGTNGMAIFAMRRAVFYRLKGAAAHVMLRDRAYEIHEIWRAGRRVSRKRLAASDPSNN